MRKPLNWNDHAVAMQRVAYYRLWIQTQGHDYDPRTINPIWLAYRELRRARLIRYLLARKV